ncbi:hypothetical protein RB195_016384 [Necator americanus]|uniref:Ubiquitin carboxyl-terminal hydrolase n=1 Tax=Necator americanus TaxID=51031 RepID=A0ABR1E8W2_NECAM
MAKVEWQALESNPEAINPFMEKIGVKSVKCIDIFSFDDDALKELPKPQLAMLLCLPDYKKVETIMAPIYEKLRSECVTPPANVFFMEQKINNACGTFALFHALANIEDLVDLGSGSFHKWLEAAKGVGIDQRSDLLANDPSLAAAHEEAARCGDSRQPEEIEHHFVCYVNKDGTLFEIDSRAPFPRPIGVTTGDTLVKDAEILEMSMPQWRALESNPDTINAFMNKIGVRGVECVDVFSFEPEMLEFIPAPQLALILCFPEKDGNRPLEAAYDALRASGEQPPTNVFFMKQKIENACGTFALFHSLANLEGVVDLGSGSFSSWLKEAKQLSAEERSDSLLRNTQLAAAHEETAMEGETEEATTVEHHFICYVEKDGILYEIDSSAPFPRSLGEIGGEQLLSAAAMALVKSA